MAAPCAPALADVTGPARVIDGDTLEVQGERIRLDGIDAPESRQLCRLDGYAVWRRILRTVRELGGTAPEARSGCSLTSPTEAPHRRGGGDARSKI